MKLSVSNIAWPIELTDEILPELKGLGISALEIAPTKIWPDIFGVDQKDAARFLRNINNYGLSIAGFHALLFGQDHFSIFGSARIRKETLKYLLKLGEICSWLGGKILVFGSTQCRRRGDLKTEECETLAAEFFYELAEKCKDLDVTFLIEPLGRSETDFIDSAVSALSLIKNVNHSNFKGHLDAKALAEAGEITEDIFNNFKPFLRHVHVNDPNLTVLDELDKVGHARIGQMLRMIEYKGYISLEQRAVNENPISACLHSVRVMKRYYKNESAG